MSDIRKWLNDINLGQYAQVFEDNEITKSLLPRLTEEALEKIGVTAMGHRLRLLDAIAMHAPSDTADVSESTHLPAETPHTASAAERRHLTVMFVDLVGSTEMATKLDPEDMRDVITHYQNTVAGVIAGFDGFVAKFMGDGVMCYFGWPRADEDDAERAVRAGLVIIDAVKTAKTPTGETLASRIGIATGVVIVGDLVGNGASQEAAVVGETPNIAARLQSIAHPDQLVLPEDTRKLLGSIFELESIGAHSLKGIAAPVAAYRVVGENSRESRFEERQSGALTPLVGRNPELGSLTERWAQACNGAGQIVLVSGEPGIGKSRLLKELKDHVAQTGATQIEMRCSPYHQNSMFHPIIDHLQRLLEFGANDKPQEKLEKLEQMLVGYRFPDAETYAVLATLLSLPIPEETPQLNVSPQKRKQLTEAALVAWLLEETDRQAVCSMWEDLHWADASTLDLLNVLLTQIPTTSLLAVLTFRPEFIPTWGSHSYLCHLNLSRLAAHEVGAMVARVTDNIPLPTEVVKQIATKTDGVPLFVEELTKMVIESGLVREENGDYVLAGPLPPLAIPSTLHDSLMARLDRLAGVREVAQIGATIGREFSYELLAAVSTLDEDKLQTELNKLVMAELIYQRGLPPHHYYVFKHALIQDTAYQLLLKGTRQSLHAQIAQVIEQLSPSTVDSAPELLALHYTGAALYETAITYWQKAGERAVQHSANPEAVEHLSKGLELIVHLSNEYLRISSELALLAQLGPALIAAKGYGAPETANCFDRAHELTNSMDDSPHLFPVLYGCWVTKLTWAEFPTVRIMAERFLKLAQKRNDTSAILTGHRILGFSLSCLGEFDGAKHNFEKVLDLYQPNDHAALAFRYGQDPKAAGTSMLAWNLWHLGYPDQAVEICDQAVAYAKYLDHTNTRGYVETFGAARIHLMRRDQKRVQEFVNSMTDLCEEHSLIFWIGFIKTFEGWILVDQGAYDVAVDKIKEGLEALENTNTAMFKPHGYALLAQAFAGCDRFDESLHILDEALTIAINTSEHWITPELYRLRGEILLQSGDIDKIAIAESLFEQSLTVARERSARSWELRSATSLAGLRHRQGKSTDARKILAPILANFTEGYSTSDYCEAKVLLDQLA